jgi:hypothetical protein
MKMHGVRNSSLILGTGSRFLILCALLALFASMALGDEKKPPAKAPAKPAASAPKGGAAHGATSAGHGPTTSGAHGPTTAGHSTTTTGAGGATTTGHGATTTTTHGPSTTGAGHTATTSTTGGRGTTGATVGRGTPGGAAAGRGATGAGTSHATNTGAGRVPKGATVVHTKGGGEMTRRSDGKVASLHDPKRGMDVHRGLNGNRRVVVERGDHSRVFVEHGGHGYVQRPYMYHGHEYASRSYYYHGAYYHNYYGRYNYRGVYVNPYYPAYYYGPAYYGWVYNPWAAPVSYAWGWGGNPWYGYYGGYFTPYPVYASPSLWLTDYMISSSLATAYQARAESQQGQGDALSNPAPLTPEVKQEISDEVRRQVALENAEAQSAGQNSEPDAASSSIQRSLTDGVQHVFVAGQDLDLVDASGAECAISQGDALQLTGQNPPDATSVNLAVLASKGGRECPKGDTVSVALQDLQDMQNNMRETIDRGMKELQAKQGKGGLPAAPASAKAAPVESAMALNAPPPPPEKEVAAELSEQSKSADAAEKEAVADTGAGAVSASAETPTVSLGQTPDQVAAALGKPKSIMDLGAKKIYVYQDMKVTFNGGKVTDIK